MLTKLIAIFAFLWAGMIVGISFLASWAKFRAPSLTKSIGLDVGRTVFRIFHKTQCFLLLVIIFLTLFTECKLQNWIFILFLTTMFMLQIIWLFPKLSQHVDIILSGNTISQSFIHALYGMCEINKFLFLILLGTCLMT